MSRKVAEPIPESVAFDRSRMPVMIFNAMEAERQASFFLTGGYSRTRLPGADGVGYSSIQHGSPLAGPHSL